MKTLTLLLSIIIVSSSISQQKTGKYTYNGNSYSCIKIKLTPKNIAKFFIIENNNKIPHNEFLNSNNFNHDEQLLSTTSIVDPKGMPVGLYVNNYKEIKPTNKGNGQGNFYLKPNGAFLIMDDKITVCETSEIHQYNNIKYGVQSGPMLIHNGIINHQFNQNSKNKYIRSAVGMSTNNKGEEFIIFALSDSKVSFYDFSEFFLNKFKCDEVLNIESSRPILSIPYLPNESDESATIINRYIVY